MNEAVADAAARAALEILRRQAGKHPLDVRANMLAIVDNKACAGTLFDWNDGRARRRRSTVDPEGAPIVSSSMSRDA